MAKVLFVPTNSRQIAQFNLIKPELEALNCEIMTIALDKGNALDKGQDPLENILQKNKYCYKQIADYRTRNVLNIIKVEKPDIIIISWNGFTPNALIYAANYTRIPCLRIDDGITSDYFAVNKIPSPGQSFSRLVKRAFRLLLLKANPRPLLYLTVTLASIYRPGQFVRKMASEMRKSTYPISSYTEGLNIAVISPFARSAHISMGAPPDKVFITGQPRFDLIRQPKSNGPEIREQLKIPAGKGIIVLATQPIHTLWTEVERREFIDAIIGTMSEFPEKQLVIKLHPSEKKEEYQRMLARTNNNAIICRDIDLYGLLVLSELLMTVHSTVALEAMILHKPVITVNLTGKPDVMPYAESGAALGVYRKEDLAPAINKALYDPEVREKMAKKREQFVYDHAYKPDGQATKRVADLIVRLIEESKKKEGVIV